MELWLDSTNLSLIEEATLCGILHGVTTNPTLLAGSMQNIDNLLQALLSSQQGPVAVQVTKEDSKGMLEQAEALKNFSSRIIIKVPVTVEGLKTIRALSLKQVPTMATVIFHPNQALLAAKAGAHYVAPYLTRIEQSGENALEYLRSMHLTFKNYNLNTKILAASIKNTEQVRATAEMGIHAITLKNEVFKLLLSDHKMTIKSLEQFAQDWKKAQSCLLHV